MSRSQRSTPAGRAYLDLQHLARRSGRSMQALLPMFASERWLARMAASQRTSSLDVPPNAASGAELATDTRLTPSWMGHITWPTPRPG
jgi:hypothetical protein